MPRSFPSKWSSHGPPKSKRILRAPSLRHRSSFNRFVLKHRREHEAIWQDAASRESLYSELFQHAKNLTLGGLDLIPPGTTPENIGRWVTDIISTHYADGVPTRIGLKLFCKHGWDVICPGYLQKLGLLSEEDAAYRRVLDRGKIWTLHEAAPLQATTRSCSSSTLALPDRRTLPDRGSCGRREGFCRRRDTRSIESDIQRVLDMANSSDTGNSQADRPAIDGSTDSNTVGHSTVTDGPFESKRRAQRANRSVRLPSAASLEPSVRDPAVDDTIHVSSTTNRSPSPAASATQGHPSAPEQLTHSSAARRSSSHPPEVVVIEDDDSEQISIKLEPNAEVMQRRMAAADSTSEGDDAEDLRLELREIEIKRKLLAMTKRKSTKRKRAD